MSYSSYKYPIATLKMGNEDLADLNDVGTVVKCALLKVSYTFSNTHSTMDDIRDDEGTNHEVDAGGEYVAGGKVVDNILWEQSGNHVHLKGDAVEWESSTITAAYAVFYVDGVTDTDRHLLALIDFDGEKSSVSEVFRIRPDGEATGGRISVYDHAAP